MRVAGLDPSVSSFGVALPGRVFTILSVEEKQADPELPLIGEDEEGESTT